MAEQGTFSNADGGSGGASSEGEARQIQPRLVAVKTSVGDIVNGIYFEVSGRWEPDYLLTPLGMRVSRVNLIGLVVANFFSEDGNYGTITLDDGTETIRLKAFKGDVKMLRDVSIGQIVCVIGKLRKYREEVYIAPETIIPSDAEREILRRLEILREKKKLAALRELVSKTASEFDEPSKLVEFLSSKYGLQKETIEAILISQNPPPAAQAAAGPSSAPEQPAEEAAPPSSQLSESSKKAKESVLAAIESGGSAGMDYGAILRQTGLSALEVDDAIKELIGEGEIFEPKSGRFRRLL